MKAKPIIIGIVILAIAAALFYFFVVKPKQATTTLVPVVNADGTVTTRAMTSTALKTATNCYCGMTNSPISCYGYPQNCIDSYNSKTR